MWDFGCIPTEADGGLRSEFGGPQFEPHVTVVGAVILTESEARDRFTKACERLESYDARVDRVANGNFLLPVVDASAHCRGCFGYKNSTPYTPQLSLLYGDITEEEKKTACEKAYVLDENISSLIFKITHLALYKTNTEDKSCKSWEKVAERELRTCQVYRSWPFLRIEQTMKKPPTSNNPLSS